MDLNNKTAFRASVFAGKDGTENDNKHRSIFTLSAAPDTDWHELAAVYKPTGASYYLDGEELSKSGEGADDLAATCASLFGEELLSSYTYCGIGHSLYNDNDLRAKIDDVEFYAYPITISNGPDQLKPVEPTLYYTFEEDTITEGEPSADPESGRAPDGTALTSVPSLQAVSPDGTLTAKFWRDGNGRYYYSVNKMSEGIESVVIQPSRLGLVTSTEDLSSGFGADPAGTVKEYDETYKMPYGKHMTIRNHYTEVTFPLTKGSSTLTVTLRAYDDGVGVRYGLNHGASIKEEQTQVMFPGNGWEYVTVDFGWAMWDDSAAKIKELCDYGAERGVGIWLWYGVNNTGHSGYKDSQGHPAYPYYSLLDEATIKREFERISGLGVKGVKVDYYESDTQETMKQMYLCATIAAQNKLMVLFHGCTLPRGESRTYPNVVSFEAINGTEYYKWFTSPSLQNRVSYTFTRCVAGSADFTPTGIPVLNSKATAGFALADVVTIESGLQHFAHSVYTYEGSSALPFLNDVPVVWDDMKVLDGRPMQFNVTARRSGNNWYIGASTISARKISVKLSELIDDDGTYNAYIFHDNANGSDLEVTVKNGLTKKDVIEQSLLANGGCVMKITKGSMKLTTPYSNYLSYEAEKAKIESGARITDGKDGRYSSGGAYVGYVGGSNKGTVTFENVTAPADGEYTLRIYYVSGEMRSIKVDVNGAFATKLDGCYANKGDWTGIAAKNITVRLKAGKNTVKLYNDQGTAPSIDRIALAIPNEEVLAGDMNFDGIVNAVDLSLLKRGLMNGFTGSKQEHAADFNRNGKKDIADIRSMVLFLTTQA